MIKYTARLYRVLNIVLRYEALLYRFIYQRLKKLNLCLVRRSFWSISIGVYRHGLCKDEPVVHVSSLPYSVITALYRTDARASMPNANSNQTLS
jgi:hypothetical protein